MPTISQVIAAAVEYHNAGDSARAAELCRRILQVAPENSDALYLLGMSAFRTGNLAQAVDLIQSAIRLGPEVTAYHASLGDVFSARGDLPAAEISYRQAVQLSPDNANVHESLGIVLRNQGRFGDALVCFRKVLELVPDRPHAHLNLGSLLLELAQAGPAEKCFRRVLELQPDFAEGHYNLGIVMDGLGRPHEALDCYRRALRFEPGYAAAQINLANVCKDLGMLDEAADGFRRALELRPDLAELHNSLGNVLLDQEKPAQAVDLYRRAIELKPEFAEAHANLGNACMGLGKTGEAVAWYRRALEVKPDYATAHMNLGNALLEMDRLDEAIECLQRALERKPDYGEALSNLANVLRAQGKVDEAVDCYRRALELRPDFAAGNSNLLFLLHYAYGEDAKSVYEEHCRWNQRHAAPLAKFIRPHGNERSPDRRLRIGYVSPDFREHCQSFFTIPLLAAHDRRYYEVFCYAGVTCPDEITARLRSCSDTWRDIVGLSDEQVAELVRQDEIDILVDLTMHMANNRIMVFARKPAPVQVCWLAYPGTTGLTTIDYRLTDPYLDPPGLNDPWYSEESIRLPETFWCYDPLTNEPAVNALPALANGYVTFGCLNSFFKFNPFVLKLWADTIRLVDGSRLLLLVPEGSCRERTLDVLEQHGVSANRVQFVGRCRRTQYLELYHQIDVALDTFPTNGHTTSLDSLWMGVPVVTLVGSTAVSRAGLCQLMNLGLPELIASEPDQFPRIAVALAKDLPRLAGLRGSFRARMQSSPLMDGPRFAKNVEAAYRGMWQRWCASQ